MPPLLWSDIQKKATAFARRWREAWRERAQAQPFLLDFLAVFGVADPAMTGEFDKAVRKPGATDLYVDYFCKGVIAVEMKSAGKPFGPAREQLAGYMERVPEGDIPDLWMVCDFQRFEVWRRSTRERASFPLKDLRRHIRHFAELAGYEAGRVAEDKEAVNVRAAEKMDTLASFLRDSGYDGHDLEVYLVRLLFCLFAEGTGLLPHMTLYHYLQESGGTGLSVRIGRLFEALNPPVETRRRRQAYPAELLQFPHVNGRLFGERLPEFDLDAKMRDRVMEFIDREWRDISPAIFGAMFQAVMDPEKRRNLGAHYTSEENILRAINPLFMDGLWKELEAARGNQAALEGLHAKIAGLKVLDPACGCGNFLIIAYRELRRLELEILKIKLAGVPQRDIDLQKELRVRIEQFAGIEIESWPCQVAQVAMWLMDHHMNMEAGDHFGAPFHRLPLTEGAKIVNANALRMDWGEVAPRDELAYIVGNPPFVGASMMSARQKTEAVAIFGKIKLANSIDYAGAWYHKAAALMRDTGIRTAFVSTNSVTQGEQVAPLWGKVLGEYGARIDFAWRTFKWSNEARGKAAVYCVIMGLSHGGKALSKVIYEVDGSRAKARNINAYLVDAPDVLIESRPRPLGEAPRMYLGNKPADGRNLVLTPDQRDELLSREPQAGKLIRKYVGADEYLNATWRYCLWLKDVPYADLENCPSVLARVKKVKAFRLASSARSTVEMAETPHLFFFISHPDARYLLIPSTSSENRRYIPIGFMDRNTIASNANMILPGATLYHFGILTSSVHMAWTRAVCGRLEMRYRYTGAVVYNNFPWPEADKTQRAAVEPLARSVLDARKMYPGSTPAAMYNDDSMPFHPDLVKAHKALDMAVMRLYGFPKGAPEPAIVAELMKRHQRLVNG